MNIFATLKSYANQFKVANTRAFSEEELNLVNDAKVVLSQYGMSVCFFMTDGCQKYIPLSRDSVACDGDKVDLKKAKILTLVKEGSDEKIDRIEI
jgi:hypothetical protein